MSTERYIFMKQTSSHKKAKVKPLISAGLLSFLLIFCSACSGTNSSITFTAEDIPDEIESVIKDYLIARQTTTSEESVEKLFFLDENSFEREAYKRSYNRLKSADVLCVDRINDNLYAVTLDATWVNLSDKETSAQIYNFVAFIDKSWVYILADHNIPADVLAGADLSAYSYPDQNFVSSSDVIH